MSEMPAVFDSAVAPLHEAALTVEHAPPPPHRDEAAALLPDRELAVVARVQTDTDVEHSLHQQRDGVAATADDVETSTTVPTVQQVNRADVAEKDKPEVTCDDDGVAITSAERRGCAMVLCALLFQEVHSSLFRYGLLASLATGAVLQRYGGLTHRVRALCCRRSQ